MGISCAGGNNIQALGATSSRAESKLQLTRKADTVQMGPAGSSYASLRRLLFGPQPFVSKSFDKNVKIRDGPGVRDPQGDQKSMISGPTIREKMRSFSSCFLKTSPLTNHETTTFRASLKPQGPRDRACGKEHEILCRIALTRALYDQIRP